MLYEKEGYRPDWCRTCLNYRRKVLPSVLMNTIEQFIVYVHRNEAHSTYIYVHHTSVFEADNVYKKPPLKVISPRFFLLFVFHSTHDCADCWSTHRPQLPTIASNVCTTDARPGVGLPQTKILATHVFIVLSCSARRLKFVLYSCFEGIAQFCAVTM